MIVSTISRGSTPTLSAMPMWYSSWGSAPPSAVSAEIAASWRVRSSRPCRAVDVAVAELDDVARQIGRDVANAFDRALALLAGQLAQALPAQVVPIVRHCAYEGTPPSDPVLLSRPWRHHDNALTRSIREAEELLQIEEADAWFEYLEATRNQSVTRYREVEPWAWARLNQRLRALGARRAKLKPATAA